MIGRYLLLCLHLGISGILTSCVTVSEIKPEDYLNRAKELIHKQQFQMAKLYVDSVRICFPKEYAKIREGIHIMREINFAEQSRTLSFCDSMLRVRQNELPDVQKKFKFVKDDEYETIGHYIHRTQADDLYMSRTYLQTKVDEKGNLILTSFYCGSKPLGHNQLRVSASDGTFAETLTVPEDGALNFSFKDGSQTHEIVCFNRKKEHGVVDFILYHRDSPVTIRLIGKTPYTYPLSLNDKAVVKDAMQLSGILSDITHLLDEIRLVQAKLEYIRQKQQSDSESNTETTN